MLNSKSPFKLVFLDIETKPIHESFSDLPAKLKSLFVQKYDYKISELAHRYYLETKKKEGDHELSLHKACDDIYKENSHLSPEFAQIICISAGMIMEDYTFKCASFCGETEKEILTGFLANKKSFIHQSDNLNNEKYAVTFNGSQWDIPFLSRRILYNGLELPAMLDIGSLKPWDCGFLIDLKTQIKFGGMDAPSLESLCTMLNVETALDKFKYEASNLSNLYKGKQFEEIKAYCEQDILALANCYLKLIRSKEHPQGITNQLTKV